MFTNNGKTISIRREFNVPVAMLYQAWSQPQVFKTWWKEISLAEMDFKEGGSYRLQWQGDTKNSVVGTYKQIMPEQLVVFTWSGTEEWSETKENIITLTFRPLGPQKCEFQLKHELSPTEETRDSHHEGWTWAMLNLDQHFHGANRKIREDLKAHVTRTYDYPIEKVYQAWTNSAFMAKWFNRKDATLGKAKADVKVGGSFFMDFQMQDGNLSRTYGSYSEVVPESKLVFSWIDDECGGIVTADRSFPSRVTVTFTEIGNKTKVDVHHDRLTSEVSMASYIEGWTDCVASIQNRLELGLI